MEDIGESLLFEIEKQFNREVDASAQIKRFLRKVRDGTATQTDVIHYDNELGNILARCYQTALKPGVLPNDRLYWNIATKIIDPMVKQNFELITDNAKLVQDALDAEKNIGVANLIPEFDEERLKGLKDNACVLDLELDEIKARLDEPIKNITDSFWDEFVKKNAKTKASAGFVATITRTATRKCCEWCSNLAGKYNYENAPQDIYRRHENCRCQVTYTCDRYSQDVHTKATTYRK